MGRLPFRHPPVFGREAGRRLPVGLPSRGRRRSWRSISSPTTPTRATPCGSTRPRPSCGPCSRRPDGCPSSIPIRTGPMAGYGRRRISLGGAVSPDSVLSRCDLWLADYREQPEVPYAWANAAGASGSMSATRPRAMRPTAACRAPSRASATATATVRRRQGGALPFLEGQHPDGVTARVRIPHGHLGIFVGVGNLNVRAALPRNWPSACWAAAQSAPPLSAPSLLATANIPSPPKGAGTNAM